MSIVQQLAAALEPWKTYWADHDVVSTAVTTTHVVCIVIAAGLAIAADRMTLRVRRRADNERLLHARELRELHRPVLAALTVVVISGVLMAGSDIEEFFGNPVFWVKMGLIVVLLINGLMLQKYESRLLSSTEGGDVATADWSRLSVFARVSMTLWIATTIAGMVLAS
jgi:uncharacterized membrane protein